MSKRMYVSTADSYAILRGAVLQGLGASEILPPWPKGRSYHDTGFFRSPYANLNYFQDGSLLGLGAPPSTIAASIDAAAPPHTKRYLLSGEPVPRLENNVSLPFNQVPRLAYGLIAATAAALGYVSYKRHKKGKAAGG